MAGAHELALKIFCWSDSDSNDPAPSKKKQKKITKKRRIKSKKESFFDGL